MDARELRYFVALAEERHFGRAAAKLGLAPSALSRAISGLEEDLAVQLFKRDAHGVTPSELGEAMLAATRDALAALDEALAAAVEAGGGRLTGSLAVGIGPSLRHRVGPSVLEGFGSAYPGVALAQREEFGGPLVEQLLARRLDVGLALWPPIADGLLYEPIGDAQLIVLVSRRHPLAGRPAVNLFELAGELFLAPSAAAEPGLRERSAPLFAGAGFEPSYGERPVEHDGDMRALIAGEGVMLASRFFVDALPREVRALELEPRPQLPFELVRRAERPAPGLRRFLEVARAVTRDG